MLPTVTKAEIRPDTFPEFTASSSKRRIQNGETPAISAAGAKARASAAESAPMRTSSV